MPEKETQLCFCFVPVTSSSGLYEHKIKLFNDPYKVIVSNNRLTYVNPI